jgi:hypothetical protein
VWQLRAVFGERLVPKPKREASADPYESDGRSEAADAAFAEKLMRQGNREDKYR